MAKKSWSGLLVFMRAQVSEMYSRQDATEENNIQDVSNRSSWPEHLIQSGKEKIVTTNLFEITGVDG